MELINDINILRVYNDINSKPQNYDANFRDSFKLYPESIRKIIEQDRFVQPRHINQEIIQGMFIQQCKNFEPAFEYDEFCGPVINALCLYVRQDQEFLKIAKGYSFAKGILLRGKVGCGKSILMKAMNGLLRAFSYIDPYSWSKVDLGFTIVESWKISEEFTKVGFDINNTTGQCSRVYGLNNKEEICIDDIGSELVATNFGNTVNIVGSILMDRYNKVKSRDLGEYITHGTSNLDVKHLSAFYGERVFSRMKEMFNDMVLTGNDRRE